MSNEYMDGMQKARGEMLGRIRSTDQKIAKVYEQAYQDIAEQAAKQKSGTLTERWQLDMSKSLKERMNQLNGDVTGLTISSVQQAGQLPGKATADWLDLVLSKAGAKGTGDAFRSVLTRTSDEALTQVLNGSAYLDSKSLSRRIWQTSNRARDGINAVIQQGIAQKKSAYELTRDLEQFINPDAWEDFDWAKVYPDIPSWLQPLKVEKHAQTVARTSINHAYHLAMKEAAAKNPFVDCIHWALSSSHFERQILPFGADVCDEYSIHDEGLGPGNYPIQSVPLPHPRCLCNQYGVVGQSLAECADELKRWLDGESNRRLDHAFGDWKNDLGVKGSKAAQKASAKDERGELMKQIAQQSWTQELKHTDREAVYAVLNNASLQELEFFAKNGTMIRGNFYDKQGGYYNPLTKLIHLDIGISDARSAAVGYPISDVRVFFHEVGHLFDYNAFSGKRLVAELGSVFEDQLAKDFLEHANQVLADAGEKTIKSLDRLTASQKTLLSRDLRTNADIKNAISDLAGGLTNNRVLGKYLHPTSYWDHQKPSTEAVAHMYEAMMIKGEKLEMMKEYFPESYKMYENAMNAVDGGAES